MNPLMQIHRRLNISTKIFILTFSLIVLLTLLLSFLYQKNSTDALIHAQTEYARQMVEKSNQYLQLNLLNIQNFFLSAANDKRLQTGDINQIDSWLNDNLILYFPNTKHITLIKDGKAVASTSPISWLLEEEQIFTGHLKNVDVPKQMYWTKPYYSSISEYTVTAIMKIPTEQGFFYYLTLDLDLSRIHSSLYPNPSSALQGDLLLLDRYGKTIFGNAPYTAYNVFKRDYELGYFEPGLFEKTWSWTEWNNDNRDLLLIRSKNNLLEWQVIWIMDSTELLGPLHKSIRYSWLIALLAFILSLVVAYAISVFISRPVKKFKKSMDDISRGQLNAIIPIDRQDELGLLAMHFNHMVMRIRQLMDNLKQTEEAKKELSFRALQSQIRPHFLFNTLNSVSMAAREQKMDKVDSLISSLTQTLHYSLDHSPAPVEFKEELKAVEHYISLMKIRYDDQFTLETDIDPLTMNLKLPKFTLQPLIENSIFHGLVPKAEDGTLFIGTSIHFDSWDLILEDSGVGMSPERLHALHESLKYDNEGKPYRHIGLKNVHDRLRFMFGQQYEIKVTSNEGKWTRIIITLPIINLDHEEEEMNHEAADR